MNHVCTRLGVAERRACRVIGHARSTYRHLARLPDDEPRLVSRMIALATTNGRYGYRRITGLLRGEGWTVNHKRVERLWRRKGLNVPQTQPQRGRWWLVDGSCLRRRPEYLSPSRLGVRLRRGPHARRPPAEDLDRRR